MCKGQPAVQDLPAAGLVIRSAEGLPLYEATGHDQTFRTYEEIPPLVRQALLLMENRELGREGTDARANPVVEWNRLAKAGIYYVASKAGMPVRMQGGSTLATQIEKYWHSRDGRTGSFADKVQQMVGECLRNRLLAA
jgi:membrane peptidoglycan carboxypeptidase